VPNCFIAFTKWSLNRWAVAGFVSMASFPLLTFSSKQISEMFELNSTYESIPFAVIFSLLLGIFSATEIRDANFLADKHSYKLVGIAVALSITNNLTAPIGLVVLLVTVRTRITNESACSLPTIKTS
jgi:hypothetical protein